MSEMLPNPQDLIGDDADEELVFDEPPAVEPHPSSASAPKLSKGRALKPALVETARADPAPMPARPEVPMISSPAVAQRVPAEEPAGGASAPFPPHGAGPAGSKTNPLLLAIVGLSLVSSLLSVGGLITVSRTLAEANAAKQDAQARQDALAGVPGLVAQINRASDRLANASARLASASPSGPPATLVDIRHELDALKLALAEHQPDGVSSLSGTTRDGFAEMAARLDRLSNEFNRTRGSAGAVSASSPASREASPKHSS
jgi:hypothetical protein